MFISLLSYLIFLKFATLETTKDMMFRGGSARIGTYNLSLQENQYSISGIWIQSGPPTELNSIQVGTGVS